MSRLFVRRSLTAVGIYSSVVLGFAATVVATRVFDSVPTFGDYVSVMAAAALAQIFFDLTVEEAVVKYGFRYTARQEWGRLRGLFRSALVFKVIGSLLGALALVVFAFVGPQRLQTPLLISAGIPLGQSLEGLGGAVLYLRSRYDIRSLLLTWSMGLRLVGVGIGAHYGVSGAIAGVLIAQVIASATVVGVGLVGFRRFPSAEPEPLGEERREIFHFIGQSSVATGTIALRQWLAPLFLLGVSTPAQVGFYKVAQAPQSAFQSLSAPARMVLLTEQTRDWEQGYESAVLRGVRRYSVAALGLAVVLVPLLYVFLPDLIRLINGEEYVGAASAGRVFVFAAAVQLVFGWTKSFPVTIGRPQLRVLTHGVETAVMLPLVLLLGWRWGATGAAFATLAGMLVFAAMWTVIFLRIRPRDLELPADVVTP